VHLHGENYVNFQVKKHFYCKKTTCGQKPGTGRALNQCRGAERVEYILFCSVHPAS